MPEIKGVLLNAWAGLLKERYGQEAVDKAIAGLKPEDRLQAGKVLLDSNWYPYEMLHLMRKVTRGLATAADTDLSEKIGQMMAQRAFGGVYRSLLAKTPAKQAEKFTSISDFFFKDTYQLKTSVEGNSCTTTYNYHPQATPTRAICHSLEAFWKKTFEMCGAEGVQSSHPECVTSGAKSCVFKFTWK